MQKMQINFMFVVKTMSIIIDICLSVCLSELMTLFNPALVSPLTDSYSSPFVQQRYRELTASSHHCFLLLWWFQMTFFIYLPGLCWSSQRTWHFTFRTTRHVVSSSPPVVFRSGTSDLLHFNLKSTLTYSIFLSTGHWHGRRLEAGAALCAGRWTLCPGAAAGTQLNVLFIFIFMFLFFFLGLISSRFSHSWTVNVTRLH